MFIQLFQAVISESFLLALLTAILLKVVLECVMWVKGNIKGRIKSTQSKAVGVLNIGVLLLVMPGSKFVVIELAAAIFDDAVHLGSFFQVMAMMIALMLTRGGVRRLFEPNEKAETAP